MSEIIDGLLCGIFLGCIIGFVLTCSIGNSINIDKENGYTDIEVVKIISYSDGEKVIYTTAYDAFLGFKISDNFTFLDNKNLINDLGKYKIKTGNDRNIDKIIYITNITGAN